MKKPAWRRFSALVATLVVFVIAVCFIGGCAPKPSTEPDGDAGQGSTPPSSNGNQSTAQIAVKDLFTVTSDDTELSVAGLDKTYTDSSKVKGVAVGRLGTFGYKINGVFERGKDLTFDWLFNMQAIAEFRGNVSVKVIDVEDENNYFEVIYDFAGGVSQNGPILDGGSYRPAYVYVKYKDQVRSRHHDSSYRDTAGMYNTANSYSRGLPYFNEYGAWSGKLSFDWIDYGKNVFAVDVSNAENPSVLMARAKFDGTYQPADPEKGFVKGSDWGLPQMNYDSGYMLEFSFTATNIATVTKPMQTVFKSITYDGITIDFSDISSVDDKVNKPSFYRE